MSFLIACLNVGLSLRTNEDTRSFQMGPNSENTLTKFIKSWASINETFLKASFGERKSIFVQVKGHAFIQGGG